MAAGGASGAVDIPVAAAHWWRADKGVTLNGADVSDWEDQVGSWDWAQATASDQPLFTASGINSQPSIDFDGVDHWMTLTTDAVSQPVDIWMVLSYDAWVDGDLVLSQGSAPSVEASGTTPQVGHKSDSPSTNKISPTITTPFLLRSAFDGASSFQSLNNDSAVSGGNPGTAGWAAATLLAMGSLNSGPPTATEMRVSEIAFYDAIKTGGDVTSLKSYFNTRYALW